MLTNLLATVLTIVTTNTTEVMPSHMEWNQGYGYALLNCGGSHEVADADPQDKWLHSKVERTRTLTFDFEGTKTIELSKEVLADFEVQFHKTVDATNWSVGAVTFTQQSARWDAVATNAPASHCRCAMPYFNRYSTVDAINTLGVAQ